jgi:oxygen-independent coproporphyrinogen-3 oxidase
MHHNTGDILKKFGYEQYEISNYARKGKESLHNTGYWQRAEYMGLGLGASSLIDNVRYKNTDDFSDILAIVTNRKKYRKKKRFLPCRNKKKNLYF